MAGPVRGPAGPWNTLAEIALEAASQAEVPASRRAGWAGKVDAPRITLLAEVRVDAQARASTGIGEFDRVLGGGPAEGAVVLVGGDPGIRQVDVAAAGAGGWRQRCPACT